MGTRLQIRKKKKEKKDATANSARKEKVEHKDKNVQLEYRCLLKRTCIAMISINKILNSDI